MIAKSAGEYASLIRILNEIVKRQPKFTPKSVFDFGSGIGIVPW